MRITIKDITLENVNEVPEPCRACLYWENLAFEGRQLSPAKKSRYEAEKAKWFLKTLKNFGNCGKILYVDCKPMGYVQYSASHRLPNIQEYGARKLETNKEETVFISCLYIVNNNLRGKGLGERLLNEVIKDLKKRGFKAVETFARRGTADNPSGPIEFYLKNGFKIIEDIAPDFALAHLVI